MHTSRAFRDYFWRCNSCIERQACKARASYLMCAVCEATASHQPLRTSSSLLSPCKPVFRCKTGLQGESKLLDVRSLRGYSQPPAIALHKNISPDIMVAGFLAVFQGDFIVGACDHGKKSSDHYVWTDVFVKRNGWWLDVASQTA